MSPIFRIGNPSRRTTTAGKRRGIRIGAREGDGRGDGGFIPDPVGKRSPAPAPPKAVAADAMGNIFSGPEVGPQSGLNKYVKETGAQTGERGEGERPALTGMLNVARE